MACQGRVLSHRIPRQLIPYLTQIIVIIGFGVGVAGDLVIGRGRLNFFEYAVRLSASPKIEMVANLDEVLLRSPEFPGTNSAT